MKELLKTKINFLLEETKKISHDQDTQTSCLLEILDKNVILFTANQLPLNVEIKLERVFRPNKYDWIEHSERAVIALAAKNGHKTNGSTMYMRWFPCNECAKSIVNAGIKYLYCDSDYTESNRYKFSISETILTEGGVVIKDIKTII